MSAITTTEAPSHSLTLQDQQRDRNPRVATFNYWATTSEPQQSEILPIFSGRSSGTRTVQCLVTDIRPLGLSTFNLSTHGFQVLHHASALLPPQTATIPDFHDVNLVNAKYWPRARVHGEIPARRA